MPAEIIQFPRKSHLKKVRSVDLFYSWDKRLNNPYLNSLFREEICYIERWLLQVQHLLNTDQEHHPIIQTLLSTNDATLDLLIECTERDLKNQQELSDYYTIISVEQTTNKLNKWLRKWRSLHHHRQKFYSS